MDYPNSLPNAGLVGGKFVDEDPVAGTPGSLIPSAWGNAVTDEIIAVIEAAGLAPDEEDSAQMVKAIRLLQQGAVGGYASDTGVANAYAAAYAPAVSALADGMVLRIKVANTNTGPATFAPNGLPAKPVLSLHHAALVAGDMTAGRVAWLQYNAALASWVSVLTSSVPDATTGQKGIVRLATPAEAAARQRNDVAVSPATLGFPPGYFYGLTMANNAAAPNTTIDVAPGAARSSDDTVDIRLTSTMRGILQSSGAWAAGDNQNKLDAGVRTANTWYHKFVIRKTSDGTGDLLYSTSLTAPALPPGFAGFVLIESVLTDGSGNIIPFLNVGRSMTWKTARQDVALGTTPVGNTTITISTPPGRRVLVKQYAAASANSPVIYTHSPEVNNEVLGIVGGGSWTAGISTNDPAASTDPVAGYLECMTGLSSNIVLQTANSGGSMFVVQLATMGWEKP
ncbi:hypothetical protein [Pseudomonas sp. GZD-209]|uniref:hypothetical protein n=1 Tax=Pseudomonas sp. GZD-209 TaxID=3404807 RepID=UPI003BB746B7